MAAAAELLLRFESREALREQYEAHLRHGRAFVEGVIDVERLAPCTLKIVRDDNDDTLTLQARVVLICDDENLYGAALEIEPGPWKERLIRFVEAREPGETGAYADRRKEMRMMSIADRSRVAHGSNMDDRILLERMFGSAVWESLLHSATLTPPEVAAIARKGSLSLPLIEHIADNGNWVRHDIVRRALLTNPRTPPHCILKVLRAAPSSELKMILDGAAVYPKKVRAVLNTLRGRRT